MSPARSKRQPVPHRHSRADIVRAVAVAAAIITATSLLIWLLRPGPAGIPATGGLMNRQPRASWLVGTALGVAGLATFLILRRGRKARARAKLLVPTALGIVLVATVAGGVAWPGGLLRHAVAPAPEPTTTTTTPKSTTTSKTTTTTSKTAQTTTSAGSTSTTAAAATGGTGPATVTPTSKPAASPSK